MRQLNITIEDYKTLKKAYLEAIKNNRKIFLFQNEEILTKFAKYLLEYIETSLYKKL